VRGIWIRRLIPASIVGIVLGFSYFAPALGVDVSPVNNASTTNCGRFGYGYHGGKHNFPCPSHEPKPAIQAAPVVSQALPATRSGTLTTSQPATVPATRSVVPATRSVIDAPVPVGVSQWKDFTELLLRQLS